MPFGVFHEILKVFPKKTLRLYFPESKASKRGIGTSKVNVAVPFGSITGTLELPEFEWTNRVLAVLIRLFGKPAPASYIHMPSNELLKGPFSYPWPALNRDCIAIGFSG